MILHFTINPTFCCNSIFYSLSPFLLILLKLFSAAAILYLQVPSVHTGHTARMYLRARCSFFPLPLGPNRTYRTVLTYR